MAKICNNCGAQIADDSRFCTSCGAKNANTCRQCGEELKEGAKFCVGCGAMVEESSQGIISASEKDQVSAPPDRPQQIIESVTDEISKPDNDFIDRVEIPSLASSQNIAETVLPPINPPISSAATPPGAKKRFFSKKICFGILGAFALACVFIYMNVGILVMPPTEMIPEGVSVVYWRNDTKLPFISSPESMLLEEFGEENFFTMIAILGRIADLVKKEEITRFPYNDWLYSKSLKSIKPADPSSPSAQVTEPTEEPVALADQEGIEGMIETGNMYYEGEGVAQNYAEALKWYKKAADLGDAEAMKIIGWMYDDGDGVAQNYVEALKWFKKAADLGEADAMYKIGYMYYEGNGVAQNYGEALKWYKKAADLGYVDAMYKIGEMYEQGEGVTRNKSEAVRWFEKGAAQLEEDGLNPADAN